MVLDLEELVMILDLHRQGLSVTAIARQAGVDGKTVRKYIARGLDPPAHGPRVPRPRASDAFLSFLRERVAAYSKTLTFIGALRQDKTVAPCVFDGPLNADRFVAGVEQGLVPTLKPGDIVGLDKLASHKDLRARRAIKAVGTHTFCLLLYSPDLNAIKMVLSNFNSMFRKAGRRTVEAAWREFGALLDLFLPDECAA